ncbi:MAG: hypothetical protein AB3N28_16730 [Kordiimonas sp.]
MTSNSTPSSPIYGGNQVKTFDREATELLFADSPYSYSGHTLHDGETIELTGYSECTVFVKLAETNAIVKVQDTALEIAENDSVQIINTNKIVLAATGGKAMILVAGMKGQSTTAPEMNKTPKGQHYKVSKPWGHELWINGDHPKYVLKEIFIKAGTKTSLQYHHYKEETNVLFEGKTTLVYKADDTIKNDDVTQENLGKTSLEPLSSIHVTPRVLHRLYAETDVLLYEVSTPYLDDVIRVSDDSKRPDGRVQTEHGANQ